MNPEGSTRTTPQAEARPPESDGGSLVLPATITVRELAERLGVSGIDVIKELIKQGVMANINQSIDYRVAAAVAQALGFQTELEAARVDVLPTRAETKGEAGLLEMRAPVVAVLGHVDHGKTTLLDTIRRTNVAGREAGGITQHIGAYQVEVNGHRITFLDTPGHEAFTAMRARGARVTDIAVIVVAADDGIMPQSVEAIDHAKAAGVPIVVAINKVDLPAADPERVKQQLTQHGLLIEEWGGDIIAIPVSAKMGQGLKDLLDNILVVAEVSELKANPQRPAVGTILEAELDSSRGPVATILVQDGTLHAGDAVVAGHTWGRVRAMFNEWGQRIKEAGPSVPVKVLGLESVPLAGDGVEAVGNERRARAMAEERRGPREALRRRGVSLEALYGEVAAGKVKELAIILKTDVQGSIEPIRSSLERLSQEQVKVRVIHAASGRITESDVMLALASNAIIIGFGSRPDASTRQLAEVESVDIRYYDVIYQVVADVGKALSGLLEPVLVEVVDGHAEVRQLFRVRAGRVAGCYVLDGTLTRNAPARVVRRGEVVHTSRVASLRRFQEDAREVRAGYECGIGVEGFEAFQEGDIIESFHSQRQVTAVQSSQGAYLEAHEG